MKDIPDFTDLYNHSCVPEMLGELFSNHINMNLGQKESSMIIDLFIIYVDLLERVSEETARAALKIGAGAYYQKVLDFGSPNSKQENQDYEENHPLV